MRYSLSCQWCRRSKVKCRHNGAPPCQACTSNPLRACVLSLPRKRGTHSSSTSGPVSQGVQVARGAHTSPRTHGESTKPNRSPESLGEAHDIRNDNFCNNMPCASSMTEASGRSHLPNNSEDILASIDRETIMHAVEIFQQRFTMFSFLHGPTLLSLIYGEGPLDLRFCGILALCARFIPKLIERHKDPLSASEHFAAYLRRRITCQAASGHDLSVTQALLLLSFHDWGAAKGGQAWTYIGASPTARGYPAFRGSSSPASTPTPHFELCFPQY